MTTSTSRAPRRVPFVASVVVLAAIGASAFVTTGDGSAAPARLSAVGYPDMNNYDPPSDEHYVRHI